MAKYFGKVGYADTVETSPGVWEEVYTEQEYFGDVLTQTRKLESGVSLNDNVSLQHEISIIADAYALDHFANIRYLMWMGVSWEVSSVKVEHPRLILSVRGVYNGHKA